MHSTRKEIYQPFDPTEPCEEIAENEVKWSSNAVLDFSQHLQPASDKPLVICTATVESRSYELLSGIQTQVLRKPLQMCG